MAAQRITKRTVDTLRPNDNEFTVWDDAVTGFGVRVRPTGSKSYVVVYRAGARRGAPVRRYTIASVGKITPERARARAKVILGAVATGTTRRTRRPQNAAHLPWRNWRTASWPIMSKRKPATAEFFRDILDRLVKPAVGTTKADKLTRLQVGKLHSSLSATPFQANRVLVVVGSMYAFAGGAGLVPEGTNPAKGIDKFKESRRERFLTSEEMERLGSAIREAETTGIPWKVDKSNAKHVPKAKRSTKIAPPAAAVLRLLLFTGCRLREILHLRWEYVDIERGCLFLPDSKTGRQTIILNAPALSVLTALERVGPYVVPGDDPEQPRHDLKRRGTPLPSTLV
jgi:integrase